jgi:hypothetical protein
MVRCAQCSHDWVATPVEEVEMAELEIPPEPVAEPEPPPPEGAASFAAQLAASSAAAPAPFSMDTPLSGMDRLTDAPPYYAETGSSSRGGLLTAAWIVSLAALVGLGAAGYAERDLLMQRWPASKRVYATLGLVQSPAKDADEKAAVEKPAQ